MAHVKSQGFAYHSTFGPSQAVLVIKTLILSAALHRDALHARSSGASSSYANDLSQVSINMPDTFDLDNEVEGLRGQIGRLKQVCTIAAVLVTIICTYIRVL